MIRAIWGTSKGTWFVITGSRLSKSSLSCNGAAAKNDLGGLARIPFETALKLSGFLNFVFQYFQLWKRSVYD